MTKAETIKCFEQLTGQSFSRLLPIFEAIRDMNDEQTEKGLQLLEDGVTGEELIAFILKGGEQA